MNAPRQRAARAGGAAPPRLRVVTAEPGPGGHDSGTKAVARALRAAGREALRTGPHRTPEQIIATVLPAVDVRALAARGVTTVFVPGADVRRIVESVDALGADRTKVQEPAC